MTNKITINYGTSGFINYETSFINFELSNVDIINLNPEIKIDSENKLIYYYNKLPIGQYIVGNVEIIVKPNLYYNIHNVLYQEDVTFTPVCDNIYNFSDKSYNLPITIDKDGKFNTKELDIGEYNFDINDCLIFFKVLPIINYSFDEFIFDEKMLSSTPNIHPKNGTFTCIYPIDENGVINLSNLDMGSYNINVDYTINNITNNYQYSVTILSDLIYKNNYECYEFTNFQTEQPIYQQGGTFSIKEINAINLKNNDSAVSLVYYYNKNNLFEILENGIIKCNCEANNYELIITYSKGKSAKINILVKPYILYQNINKIVYGNKYISGKPKYYINDNSYFFINNNNFYIDDEGIITQTNLELPPDNYNLIIIYSKNDVTVETNITLTIIPFIELKNNKNEYFINEQNNTTVNYLPIKKKFNEHGILKQTNDIIIDTVGKYTVEYSYFYNDICNFITFEYIVKPIIIYKNYVLKNISNILPDSFYPKKGIFTLYNLDMFINSETGEIHFNNLNIGTYNINVIYTVNDIKSTCVFTIKIEPTINVEELNIYYNDVPKEDIDIMTMVKYDLLCEGTFENNILNIKNLDCGSYEYTIIFNYLDTFITFPVKINILKSELKLIFTCINKVYDGNNFAYVSCNNKSITFEAKYTDEKAEYYKDIYIKIINFENNNYFVNDTKIKGSILKKPINPIFIGIDKEYDGNNKAKVNYEFGDFKIESMNTFFSLANVGRNIINVKNIKFYDKNYYIEQAEYQIEANIFPKKIVPDVIVKDKIYDDNNDANKYIYFKLNMKIISFDAYYEDINIGNKIIFIKNIILEDNNFIIEDFITFGKIIPQEIKLDLVSIDKCYDGTDIAFIKEDILLKSCEAKYTNINIGPKNILITNIELNDPNFFMQDICISGYIYPQLLDIVIKCKDKYYDGTTNLEYELSDLISGSVLLADENIGENKEIIHNLYCNSNYKIKNIQYNKPNVFKKQLDCIFTCIDKEYDGTTKAFIKYDNNIIINYEAVYEDSIVGNNKKIYIKNIQTNNNNYFVNDAIIYGNILHKEIQLIAKGVNKIYDGTTDAEIIISDLNNCVDNVFIISYKANYLTPNIGCDTIIISELDLGGKNSDCYLFIKTKVSGNILAH
jgi:hypothetical protein